MENTFSHSSTSAKEQNQNRSYFTVTTSSPLPTNSSGFNLTRYSEINSSTTKNLKRMHVEPSYRRLQSSTQSQHSTTGTFKERTNDMNEISCATMTSLMAHDPPQIPTLKISTLFGKPPFYALSLLYSFTKAKPPFLIPSSLSNPHIPTSTTNSHLPIEITTIPSSSSPSSTQIHEVVFLSFSHSPTAIRSMTPNLIITSIKQQTYRSLIDIYKEVDNLDVHFTDLDPTYPNCLENTDDNEDPIDCDEPLNVEEVLYIDTMQTSRAKQWKMK